ncbi:MAG: hypothetical protein ABJG15_10635 [Hyphomonadaceae bacterium]
MNDKRTNRHIEERAEKKSETLEVRLPHSKKEAFKAACEEEGITASHAVRTFIDAYLKRSARVKLKRIAEDITMKLFRNPLKTAGIAGTGIIAAILFSASPSMAEDDAFALLDMNNDGYLTATDSQLVADFLKSEEATKISRDDRLSPTQWERLDARVVEIADTPDPSIPAQEPPLLFIVIGNEAASLKFSEVSKDTKFRTWGPNVAQGQISQIEILDNGNPDNFDMRIAFDAARDDEDSPN